MEVVEVEGVSALLQDVADLLADKAALSISPDIDFGLHQLQDLDTQSSSVLSSTKHSGAFLAASTAVSRRCRALAVCCSGTLSAHPSYARPLFECRQLTDQAACVSADRYSHEHGGRAGDAGTCLHHAASAPHLHPDG